MNYRKYSLLRQRNEEKREIKEKEKNKMSYKKYTHGFVTQTFKDGKCVEQSFTAGDQVEHEDYETGEPIEPMGDEVYFPFLMEQPKDE